MSDPVPYANGRKDYQRILLAVIGAGWSVIILAGGAWVSSIQAQLNATQTINASISVALAKLETSVNFLARDNADLRIKVNELERTVANPARGRPDR